MATMNNDNNHPPACPRSVQSDEKQVIVALPVSSYIINRMGRDHMQPQGILATDVGMYIWLQKKGILWCHLPKP